MKTFTMIILTLLLILYVLISSKIFVVEKKNEIILGDNHKNHNAIVIDTKSKSVTVDEQLTGVVLTKSGMQKKVVTQEELNKKYKNLIDASPLPQFSINLFFKKGMHVTSDVVKNISLIAKEARKRYPSQIDIIGYSDTKGPKDKNLKVSKIRAEFIKSILVKFGVKANKINVFAYGESVLLVETDDEISEMKNRRVKIVIR